ncbi:hypothetical protein C3K47_06040 [Solitalea longa]|uniref:Translocation and assembly module TamB C-terminal domain-containing protein n=1 Tax=Solitalea longa TaxID=2079460 RepID=A0A2S5A473_9SPHI|nr:translocation/assembly module TamB domain-containing protein [Solitalea longa]POY37324.1 hypothetical protein C3K47_06040 [Solitalea longa]
MRKTLKQLLKIVLWIFSIIAVLLLIVSLVLYVPAVQNLVKNKAVTYLKNKTKTEVRLASIHLNFPKSIAIKGFYIEDRKKDTLLYAGELIVNISILKLLNHKIDIQEAHLNDVTAHVYRKAPDTTFNYDFIVKSFSEDKVKEADTSKTDPYKFSIGTIQLQRIYLTFDDEGSGIDAELRLSNLKAGFKELDFEKPTYRLKELKIDKVYGHYFQSPGFITYPPDEIKTNVKSEPLPMFDIKNIALSSIDLYYKDAGSKTAAGLKIGTFKADINEIDLNHQLVNINSISLDQSSGVFITNQKPATQQKVPEKNNSPPTKPWEVKVDDFNIQQTALQYDNNAIQHLKKGIDYNHIQISNLNITAKQLLYSEKGLQANLTDLSMSEQCGFKLYKLSGDFNYDDKQASVKELEFVSPHTSIKTDIALSYPSIETVSKNIALLGIKADIHQFKLGVQDVLYFMPNLAVKNPDKLSVNLEAQVNGRVDNLLIRNLLLKTGSQTLLSLDAHLIGLPEVNKGRFAINLKEFKTSRTDIFNLVPAKMLPTTFNYPALLSLKGNFSGALTDFTTSLNLTSTSGNVQLNAKIKDSGKKGYEVYNSLLNIKQLDLGYLLKQEKTLGKVSLVASLNGSGTSLNTANANLKGTVSKIDMYGYSYKNLSLDGSIRSKVINIRTTIADPNIAFNLGAGADLNGKYPAVNLNGTIDSMDLKALNLSSDAIKFRGEIIADLPVADLDHLNGRVDLINFLVLKDHASFPIDSIMLTAISTSDSNSIYLQSPVIKASIKGKYQLSKLGESLQNTIDYYFKKDSTTYARKLVPQYLELKAHIMQPKFIKELLPDLKRFEDGTISGKLNTSTRQIELKGNFPLTVYQAIELDSLKFNINTDSGKLSYNTSFEKLAHPQLTLRKTLLSGAAQNNEFTASLSIKDGKQKEKYFLSGILRSLPNLMEFSLGEHLLLNYEPWQVAENNNLSSSKAGLLVNNLEISRQGQSIKANSTGQNANSPIEINFNSFDLQTLTKFADQDSALATGVLNGNVVIENTSSTPVFVSDLTVSKFSFRSGKVGDVNIKVNNKQSNAFATDVTISGAGNDLNLNGNYFTGPQSSFDLKLAIGNLNLNSIEGFTFGQLANTKGSINGDLLINGSVDKPNLNGSINFKQAAFTITQINSYFTLPDEKIAFNSEGIHFNEFTVQDSAQNEAVIDGSVYTQNYRDYRFDLNVATRNFRVLNTKQSNDELYYGPVYVDSDIKITGTADLPKVAMDVKLREKSILNVVLPSATPDMEDREGVIEFVDMDLVRKGITLTYEDVNKKTTKTTFKGFELSANIEIDKDASLHLIVDQQSGDNLLVKGTAQLNATMDLSGKLSLTGTYIISEGSYELSLSGIMRRKFDIEEGSSITWTGEPTSANIDITAVYNLETSAMELFENQVANSTNAADKNKYKQKLPFEIKLKIKEELMHPEIAFELDMPEEERSRYAISSTVYNRIKQINIEESELNKQVLGLLLMNRFVASDPFSSLESSGGGGVESIARQSASKILSQQLNDLAGDLIKGVDLTFDLQSEEDYSTGKMENRTDLNVGLSKELFGGRTTVYVGSNFGLEGQDVEGRKSTNIAGDVSVEYKLSRDGRYRLRAYRKDEYESVIEGQVIETGLGFILTMDYNKFRELFQGNKEKQEKTIKRKNKQQGQKETDSLKKEQ